MGDVVVRDQALTIDELLGLQNLWDEQWRNAWKRNDEAALFRVALIAACVTTGFGVCLRGEELGLGRLGETRSDSAQGLEHPRQPHVAITLVGRFKLRLGSKKRHVLPLPHSSKSGIEYSRWLMRLLGCYEREKVVGGPLFRMEMGATIPARVQDLDVLFHEALRNLQISRPDLIPEAVEVARVYSLSRSLRSGSQTQARNQNVAREVRVLVARWKSEESAGEREPGLAMPDRYTQVKAALEALLRYPKAL
jgi:hypothetical protein